MKFSLRLLLPAVLLCAAAQAATIDTTLTVTAAVAVGASGITANGNANLTNIGSGTFTGSLNAGGASGTTIPATFTITLSGGGGGTLTGTLNVPATFLAGQGSGTGSATITGGTGPYAGATGSFPSLNGTATGSIINGINLSFTGAGTVVTGGSGPGGPTGPTPPAITAVWDAAGNTKDLAPGSIFIVKGSNLCPSGTNFYNVPRPTVSKDGVKITFTSAGGTSTDALIWYTYNPSGTCQLAAILPSSVTPGSYTVTVTNGAASAPFASTVVATKPALFTQDSTGTGLASVQNYISASVVDLNSFTTGTGKSTTISPAHPNQILQVYATGVGGVAGQDNAASPVYDFTANGATVRAIVGGMTLPVLFAGRAGYAGQDQINVQLPGNVPTGCTVSFQISVNGVLSNQTFIAIAPEGAAACVAPGYTTAQLQKLDQGGTYTVGYFGISQIQQTVPQFGTVKFNSASGTFIQYSGFQLASGNEQAGGFSTAPGSCNITRSSSQEGTGQTISYKTLDAGTVSLNGPAGSNISNKAFNKTSVTDSAGNLLIAYSMTLASEGLPSLPGVPADTGTIVGGNYTISGAGGADIGSFSATLAVGTPLTIAGGLPTTVNRGSGLTINWNGGNASDIVQISGGSSTTTGTGANRVTNTVGFACYTTADQRTFTVPSSILSQLPATVTANSGTLTVVSTPNPLNNNNGAFTAPLRAGGLIDQGLFIALVGISTTASYQ